MTGIIEIDLDILLRLDQETFLKIGQINDSYIQYLYQDEILYKRYFIKKYGEQFTIFKDPIYSWRTFYLKLSQYLDEENLDLSMIQAIMSGEDDIANFFRALGGSEDLLNAMIHQNLNRALAIASRNSNWSVIHYLIQEGADDWGEALLEAEKAADPDIYEFLIDRHYDLI